METKDIYEFGAFRADGRRKSLTRNGEPVSLPGKAFDVLYALLQKPGQTVLKDELMKEVWPDTFVEEGNLTQTVFVLRKALGDTDGGQPLIVTVPRQGYRFVGELTASPGIEKLASPSTDGPAPVTTRPGFKNVWWIGAVIAIIAGVAGWLIGRYRSREPLSETHVVRFTIAPPQDTSYRAGRVSPDGGSLALMSIDPYGKGQLWVRRLDGSVSQPLATADFWPFWSPDSRFVAFAQDGKLKKIGASGGAQLTICTAPLVIGGSWNRDGTIIFSDGDAILRVPAKGGEAKPLTRLNASRMETAHEFPVFLPDGRHFLYMVHSRKRENGGVYVGTLDSPDARVRVLDDLSNAQYAPTSPNGSGFLLFARGGVLMAQPFAPTDLQLRGEAFPVVDKISQEPTNLSASFSASENGVLLVTPTSHGDQVTWFDRTGKRLGTLGRPNLHVYPQLSPDEQTVAVDELDAERFSPDIWLFPVLSGTSSRFTFHGAPRAIWSPDGRRIAFESLDTALYMKTSAGAENEIPLLKAANLRDDSRLPCEWSKDGRFLIYSQWDAKTGYDLWSLPVWGDDNRKPSALLHTEYNEWCGTLSPDGKWISYASDESGRSEIYVQGFSEQGAASGRKWQVSDSGGQWPKWRRDGKELVYLAADRRIAAVDVLTGPGFQHGAPQLLFASGIRTPHARFDVTKDGRRFLIPSAVTAPNSEPATVILNWTARIR